MRPLRAAKGGEEGELLWVLRFLEILPLELATPDLLETDGDVREVDVRPVALDVEVVPRCGVVFR